MQSFRIHLLVGVLSVTTSALKAKPAFDASLEYNQCQTTGWIDGKIPWGCDNIQHETFVADERLEAELPTVTVVCPTFEGRHDFHALLNYTFLSQSYPESKLNLLVLEDDSTSDSPLAQYWREHPRIQYTRIEGRNTIGWKRDWLMRRATGDMIVHFDDDDFYNRFYIRYMAEYLHSQLHSGAKLAQVVSWVNVYPSAEHWDQHYSGPPKFVSQCADWAYNVFGFSWIYYRDVGSKCGFDPRANYGEEIEFSKCIEWHWGRGRGALHRLGDPYSQLIKVDTCTGSTSAGAIATARHVSEPEGIVTEDTMIAKYGQDAWSALHALSLTQIDLGKCLGRRNVKKHEC